MSDEIITLPGLSHKPVFKQYSGYLNATKGRHYFYWFVESQRNPNKDPLVLWLNGGPGCSSLFGSFGENGPFKVNRDGKTLVENINSWNTIANVLYLESPAGVGFSYDENIDYQNGDKQTAQDNYLALQNFFEKFPHLKNNSFFISGESYAGVYIPMLALEIFRRNSSINLKGMAIGNGLLDSNGYARIEFAVTHGLIPTDFVNQLTVDCCKCNNKSQECDWEQRSNPKCNANFKLSQILTSMKINPYNIYSDCKRSNGFSNYDQQISDYFDLELDLKDKFYDISTIEANECPSNGFSQYLNLKEVRKAIHVSEKVSEWKECKNVSYASDRGHSKQDKSMKTTIIELITKYKVKNMIIYNGDFDIVCDFIGNQQFVDGLGLKLTQKHKKWSVNGFTAGFIKRYEGITFVTIRGAGHMVPQDKPEAALKIVKELIGISKIDE